MKKIGVIISSSLFWRRFNLYLTFFWIALIPISFATGWIKSVTFVSVLSLVALVLSSQSSWQGSRVEHKAEIRDPETTITPDTKLRDLGVE